MMKIIETFIVSLFLIGGTKMYPFVYKFETNDNQYVYDVFSNKIISVGRIIYDIIDCFCENNEVELINKFSDKYEKHELQNAIDSIRTFKNNTDLFKESRPKGKVYNPEIFEIEALNISSMNVLTLGITEECNFRCSYCIYNGDNPNRRSHNKNEMSLSTALKAVDYFKEHVDESFYVQGIGFYGGEPLLMFPLIKEVTNYAKSILNPKKLSFSITTNATLLNNEIIDFFVENNFLVLISLDGPKEYHDDKRKFENGNPTWQKIMNNLEKIKNKYPDYYSDFVMLSAVISPLADYKYLNDFFSNLGLKVRSGIVDQLNNDDFEKLRTGFTNFNEIAEIFKLEVINGTINNSNQNFFVHDVFQSTIRRIHNRNQVFQDLDHSFKHGLCTPGTRRIFVDTSGKLFPCEKIDGMEELCIGDIDHGVDVKRVKNLFQKIDNVIKDDCTKCWLIRFCPMCIMHTLDKGNFDRVRFKNNCEIWSNQYKNILKLYCSILEINENAFSYLEDSNLQKSIFY